jgi:hypothetical protein
MIVAGQMLAAGDRAANKKPPGAITPGGFTIPREGLEPPTARFEV